MKRIILRYRCRSYSMRVPKKAKTQRVGEKYV